MASISKNIRTLRNERSMTQDMLALELNVTRQTVSSWENNRTQPDIDMLSSLADVFGTDIEELIYGKKRKVGTQAEGTDKKRLLSVVLTVFGSLLAATGAIIVFVWFWQDMPRIVKTALAFLPAAIGCAAGLFALFGKKKSILLNEAAAVLWIVGIASSNALINSMYLINMEFNTLLFADILLILPVMFILNSTAAFTAYTVAGSVMFGWTVTDMTYNNSWYFLISSVSLILFAVSAVFTFRKSISTNTGKYCKWVLAASFACNFCLFVGIWDYEHDYMVYIALLAAFTGLYAVDNGNEKSCRFRYATIPGVILLMFFFMFGFCENYHGFTYNVVIQSAIAAIPVAAGIIIGRKSIKGDIYKIAFILLSCLADIVSVIHAEKHFHNAQILFAVLIAAVGITVIAQGVKKTELFLVNVGVITEIATIICIFFNEIKYSMLLMGAVFFAIGIIMLLINKRMLKKKTANVGGEKDA